MLPITLQALCTAPFHLLLLAWLPPALFASRALPNGGSGRLR